MRDILNLQYAEATLISLSSRHTRDTSQYETKTNAVKSWQGDAGIYFAVVDTRH
tara:strand:- start:190 stop:351 length:162 start_codon:yes stop_codon:yes gene_type:complete